LALTFIYHHIRWRAGRWNGISHVSNRTHLSIYHSIDNHPTPFSQEELDGNVALSWTLDSTSALDCLDTILPSEEAILEAMMGVD